MKLIKKFLMLSSISLSMLAPTILVISCSNNKKDHKNILTSQIVCDNFKEGGIWFNKQNLVIEDFENFQIIDVDAFDFIKNKLKSIELPSKMKLNKYNSPIRWKNVEEIKIIKNNNEENNLIILNGILFHKNDRNYDAITISNRIDKQDIIFPNYWDTENLFSHYSIINDFYNSEIFENVNSISFPEDILINKIGENAFLNCDKLSNNLDFQIINFNDIFSFKNFNITFGKNSFKNTNILSLNISIPSLRYDSYNSINLNILQSAFAENRNLTQFTLVNKDFILQDEYTDSMVSIENKAFYNCYSLSDIMFILNGTMPSLSISSNCFSISDNYEKKINRNIYMNSGIYFFDNNIFDGKYDSFNISMFLNLKTINTNINIEDCFDFNKLSFNKISVENIESFNLLTNIDTKYFLDVGLTNEQIEKIKYFNPSS